jgi:uncharacterized protein YjbJ (UPF0337 family)
MDGDRLTRPEAQHLGEATMNPEQFKDSWNQLKGSLKKEWRKFTDDDLLRIAGRPGRVLRDE